MASDHIFDWDQNKNRLNLEKHRVSFETAILVFNDPSQLTKFDRVKDGEDRWHTIGYIGRIPILVVHVYRMVSGRELIRIISARKADTHDKALYRKGIR